ALHEEIKKVTDQPVKYVVWENGQGHASMGSAYWKEQGAHIIAHEDAAHELKERGEFVIDRIRTRSGDKFMGTRLVMPDETFTDKKIIELGGKRIELLHLGPAHSPGDISVWLPDQKVVIAGDIAFHQRLLPVFEHTHTGEWVETWPKFEALGAEIVVPGHGEPTNMAEVTRYTVGYLSYMRERITEILDAGGGLNDVYKIDQSAYAHLDTFDELSALNASTMFRQMEFE
ncbi:MAG: MBL fold metallo-hydrolase, partial [Gammaproteobacteria bacterium]